MLRILTDLLRQLGYNEIDLKTSLRNYVSSLDIVELICIVEEKYSIFIPEEDTHIFGENLEIICEYLENAGVNYEKTES